MKRLIVLLLVLYNADLILSQDLELNKEGYFEKPGLLVTVFCDRYAEGHGGGITIIQNGIRVAANGDLRLEPTPGQWQTEYVLDQPLYDCGGAVHFMFLVLAADEILNSK